MPLANKAVPKMTPATGIMTLVNRSCARHTHTHRQSNHSKRVPCHSLALTSRRAIDRSTRRRRTAPPFLRCTNPFWLWKNCTRRRRTPRFARQSALATVVSRFTSSTRASRGVVLARTPRDSTRAIDPTLSSHARPSRVRSRARLLARSLSRAIDDIDASLAPFAPRRSCRSWSTIDRSNNDDAGEETSLTVSRLGTKS